MRAFFAITKNTFREARREKLVLLAALAALMLVGAANYFLKLDFGHERLKFVFDFSNGALGFFGSIIAVVLSCKTFHSELENRTIVTLLSKPVRAWQFVFGKMSGVGIMLGVFAAAIALAGAATLFYTQSTLPRNVAASADLPNYAGFFTFCALQWAKLCTIAAVSVFVCSLSNSMMFSTVVSFMFLAASLMASATMWLGVETAASRIFASLLPDLRMFSAAEAFAFGKVDWIVFAILAAYALVYCALCGALAAWIFGRREF